MESIEVTCYAMVSLYILLVVWGEAYQRGKLQTRMRRSIGRTAGCLENTADFRFNLVNHNNHGVDVSKYEK